MAFVRVEQRNARLAAPVRLEFVNGRDGTVAKGTVTVISNVWRATGEGRETEATSIQWTLWGKLAENAAEYLDKGSRVNVVGRLQNNIYQDAQGSTVYGLTFTSEEIDYLDSKADAEARRRRQQETFAQQAASSAAVPTKAIVRLRQSRKAAKAGKNAPEDDIPF